MVPAGVKLASPAKPTLPKACQGFLKVKTVFIISLRYNAFIHSFAKIYSRNFRGSITSINPDIREFLKKNIQH